MMTPADAVLLITGILAVFALLQLIVDGWERRDARRRNQAHPRSWR